jgi:hypothetical protein
MREESLAKDRTSKIISNSKISMFDENLPARSIDNSTGTVRVEDFKEQQSHDIKYKGDGEATPVSNPGTLLASSYKPEPFVTHNVSLSKETKQKRREVIYSSEFCGSSELKDHKPPNP